MFSAGYDEMQGKGRKKKDPISAGIKRPGRLTKLVGGKPSDHMGAVRNLARNGTPLEKREANYYENVLSKRGC